MSTSQILISVLLILLSAFFIGGLTWTWRTTKASAHPSAKPILIALLSTIVVLVVINVTWFVAISPSVSGFVAVTTETNKKATQAVDEATNAVARAKMAVMNAEKYRESILKLQEDQATLSTNQISLFGEIQRNKEQSEAVGERQDGADTRITLLEKEVETLKNARQQGSFNTFSDGKIFLLPDAPEPAPQTQIVQQLPQQFPLSDNNVDHVARERLDALEKKMREGQAGTDKKLKGLNTQLNKLGKETLEIKTSIKLLSSNLTSAVSVPRSNSIEDQVNAAAKKLNEQRLQALNAGHASAPPQKPNVQTYATAPTMPVTNTLPAGPSLWRKIGGVVGKDKDKKLMEYNVTVKFLSPVNAQEAAKAVEAGIMEFNKDLAHRYAYRNPKDAKVRAAFLNDFGHKFTEGLRDFSRKNKTGKNWNSIIYLQEAHYSVSEMTGGSVPITTAAN